MVSEYLTTACESSYKIAFFQDEYHFNPRRYEFLNRYEVDCIYTLVEPEYYSETYGKYTTVPKLVNTIPGYVSDELIAAAKKFSLLDEDREFDLRYRGRTLPLYMGKGAQEKHQIANEFGKRARGSGLRLDLQTEEKHRIYGDDWYKFMADARGVLGVEAGVSVFDPTGQVEEEFGRIVEREPDITFDDLSRRLLAPWEDQIYYRTISPRHFEAAAFRVCQILFEGKYSGIMEPMVHYIPLKKDYSNFDEVIALFKDHATREEITENAYRDLIASGRYSYRTFIEGFDDELAASGLQSDISDEQVAEVTRKLEAGSLLRRIKRIPYILLVYPYPGRTSEFPGRKQFSKITRSLSRWFKG